MAAHTPGPWISDARGLIFTDHEDRREGQLLIAKAAGLVGDEENAANARLASLAPDLADRLAWALAELNGRNRYDDDAADQQIEQQYARAEATLRQATETV